MPTTRKENFYFGLLMCSGMVLVMTLYNLGMQGLLGKLSLGEVLVQLFIGFIIALVLEMWLVGPVAKKAAFALPYDKSNKLYAVVAISFCMVTGMVLVMSLYGLLAAHIGGGTAPDSWVMSYLSTVYHNFIVALPLQLVVMGPLVRLLFGKLVKRKTIVSAG